MLMYKRTFTKLLDLVQDYLNFCCKNKIEYFKKRGGGGGIFKGVTFIIVRGGTFKGTFKHSKWVVLLLDI